ncbi:hypothetical protein SAMCCGM7_pB0322 (plasmid) [Sinorhizobium americanum CCGM7]|nr:hypothetical protein SAMCCGM7_pB0322 [Sinorhizobium americanum CCGM7]
MPGTAQRRVADGAGERIGIVVNAERPLFVCIGWIVAGAFESWIKPRRMPSNSVTPARQAPILLKNLILPFEKMSRSAAI